MKPGICTLITVLSLAGGIALSTPAWGVAILVLLATATAVVDVLRWRQARTNH